MKQRHVQSMTEKTPRLMSLVDNRSPWLKRNSFNTGNRKIRSNAPSEQNTKNHTETFFASALKHQAV
jgi:hypothetical protein